MKSAFKDVLSPSKRSNAPANEAFIFNLIPAPKWRPYQLARYVLGSLTAREEKNGSRSLS